MDKLLPPPVLTGDVIVTDPDNPFGSPAYDGPIAAAGERLAPGTYPAIDGDGQDAILTVHPDGSATATCLCCAELTCRWCRETVTLTGSGDLENSEGRLACPAQPDTYHRADPDELPAELLTGQLLVPLAQDEQLELGS